MYSGREFQVWAAATGKARLPIVTSKLNVVGLRIVRVWCMNCDEANNTPIYYHASFDESDASRTCLSFQFGVLVREFDAAAFSVVKSMPQLRYLVLLHDTTQPSTCHVYGARFYVPLDTKQVIRRRSSQPISWLGTEKKPKPNKTNNRNQRNLN